MDGIELVLIIAALLSFRHTLSAPSLVSRLDFLLAMA